MPDISQHGHSTNLIGLTTACMASHDFNENPKPLHIAGTRESASGLFEQLLRQPTREDCDRIFQDYMGVVFGFETEQILRSDHSGRRRYRNSYLRLIQDGGWIQTMLRARFLKAGSKAASDCFLLITSST
jgi:NAD+--dinitrogen-reductase ADP-D-ribosyltransferase